MSWFRYDPHDWKRNWKGLVIGALAATIVSWLLLGVPGGDEAHGKTIACWRNYSCRTPRQHVRAFNHNAYHRAHRRHYPRSFRRQYLRLGERAWYRHSDHPWQPSTQWASFKAAGDNCYAGERSSQTVSNMYYCKVGPWESTQHWQRREGKWLMRVRYCAVGLVPMIATGGAWVWVGWGGAQCLWGFSVD